MRQLILFFIFAAQAIAGYAYSRSITINSGQVTGTLTSYPILFTGTFAYLKTTANGGNVTNANGYDIAFFSDAGLSTAIPCEQVAYVATSGLVKYYVTPTSTAVGTVIYMGYNNSSVSTPQCSGSSVWDSNNSLVTHFPNGSTLSTTDSTGNNTVTNHGATATATGLGDGAASFNGTSNYMSAPNTSSLLLGTNLTIEFWMNIQGGNAVSQVFLDKRNLGGTGHGYLMAYNYNSGNIFEEIYLSGVTTACDYYQGIAGGPIGPGYHYYAGTYDGATMKLYLDGALRTGSPSYAGCSSNVITIGSTDDSSASLDIGQRQDAAFFFNGFDGETRISSTPRSASWITAVWNNLSNASAFYTVSAPLTSPGGQSFSIIM